VFFPSSNPLKREEGEKDLPRGVDFFKGGSLTRNFFPNGKFVGQILKVSFVVRIRGTVISPSGGVCELKEASG